MREKLLEKLVTSDEIRLIIQTDSIWLRRLPWHLWDFYDRYPKAEIALSPLSFESPIPIPSFHSKVQILAILGSSTGINIQADQLLLQQLPDAEVRFLAEPQRHELSEELWKEGWDILYFAGHSSSHSNGETGQIYLNQTDSLTFEELKFAVRRAVERGLKIAIFNSCDGLGLARDLAELKIPQIVIMREPVPNHVSQEFLKYFLDSFSRGESFYLAVREARERLQGLEDRFPCATWLPIIFQNPAVVPPCWNELKGCINKHELDNTLDTIPKTTEELGSIRTKLVLAKSSLDIRSALYEVEEFLTRYPNNIEARLLKDTILEALQRERIFAEANEADADIAPEIRRCPSLPRRIVVWRKVVLTLLTAAGLLYLLYIFITWIL